jgi:hypothetical protein
MLPIWHLGAAPPHGHVAARRRGQMRLVSMNAAQLSMGSSGPVDGSCFAYQYVFNPLLHGILRYRLAFRGQRTNHRSRDV